MLNTNNPAKSTSSVSSSSSMSSSSSTSSSSTTKGKKSRQTIAALAAAAAAAASAPLSNNSTTSNNLIALASQYATGAQTPQSLHSIDSIINEVSGSKALQASSTSANNNNILKPAGMSSKHIKKQHLLSASLNNTPQAQGGPNSLTQSAQKEKKTKKSKQNQQNLENENNGVTAAITAALQYQMYNNVLKPTATNTPQKMPNGEMESEEMMNGTPGNGGHAAGLMNANMEFECSACDKKFKYYCYYKRHMDACHSEWPKYVCDTCNKSYKWEASFRQHLRSHHNQQSAIQQLNGMMMASGANGGQSVPMNRSDEEPEDEDDMMGDEMDDEEIEMKNQMKMAHQQQQQRMNHMNQEALMIEPVTTTIVTTSNADESDEDDEEEEQGPKRGVGDLDFQDIEQQICQSQNETKQTVDAASTLASISDSINAAIYGTN